MSAYTFGIQGQFEIRSILWTQSSPGPYPQQVPTLPGQVALQRPGHAWWYSLSVVRTHCTPEVRVSGTGGCSHPPRRIEILPASPAVPVPSWGQPRTPGRYLNVGVLLSQTLVGQDLGNGSALPPCGKRQDRSMTSVTQQLGLMSYIWYSTPHQEAQIGLTATDPGSSSECIRMVTSAPRSAGHLNSLHSGMALPTYVCTRTLLYMGNSSHLAPRVPTFRGDVRSLCLLVCFPVTFCH